MHSSERKQVVHIQFKVDISDYSTLFWQGKSQRDDQKHQTTITIINVIVLLSNHLASNNILTSADLG